MSASVPIHVPAPATKGGRSKQRHTSEQPEGRQLQPYFDDSVTGDRIQPAQNGVAKPKNKPTKPTSRKQKATTPGKQNRRPQGLEPPAPRPIEQGYHSESGTAHYITGPRSRSNSLSLPPQYPGGPLNTAAAFQPVLPSDIKDRPSQPNDTPAKQAYAGPNFLASPAASALPMPKAFAKATPPSPSPRTAPLQSDRAQSTPIRSNSSFSPHGGREGSPLDFLFDADKAERLRHVSLGTSPLSSVRPQPQATRSIDGRSLRPTPLQDTRSRSNGASPSRKDMLIQEMDGIEELSNSSDSDDPPANSTYKDQMNALRPSTEGSGVTQLPPNQNTLQETQTEALKQMLFRTQAQQIPTANSTPHLNSPRNRKATSIDIGTTSNGTNRYPQYGALSGIHSATTQMPSQQPRPEPPRQISTELKPVSSEAPPNSASPADIKLMEDNLRKFLKIGS